MLHSLLNSAYVKLGSMLLREQRTRGRGFTPEAEAMHGKLRRRLIEEESDKKYSHPDVPILANPYHIERMLAHANKPGCRVLELGSREVTGQSAMRRSFDQAEYVGFDYYPGNNVDVAGDAHKLSHYFSEPFDLIYSYAVFEHLAMPWVVSEEISKILKVGGMVVTTTHFAYSSHERPWHFFHFSDMALRALFCPALGFECIESGLTNPIVGRFSSEATSPELQLRPVTGLYCHSSIAAKKVREIPANFDWRTLKLDQVVGDTHYPEPKK